MSNFRGEVANNPATRAIDVDSEKSDTVDLSYNVRALYVGTQGNIQLITLDGDTITFTNVSGILPVSCSRVFSTSTTATGIIGLL